MFLSASTSDGRISLSLGGETGKDVITIKYQLLNPGNHFKEVVEAARCVILAGGTMSPVCSFRQESGIKGYSSKIRQISDLKFQLFPFLSESQLSVFTCGHVIPASNLQTIVIGKGPRGGELQFKYDQRDNQAMVSSVIFLEAVS